MMFHSSEYQICMFNTGTSRKDLADTKKQEEIVIVKGEGEIGRSEELGLYR